MFVNSCCVVNFPCLLVGPKRSVAGWNGLNGVRPSSDLNFGASLIDPIAFDDFGDHLGPNDKR